MSTNYCSQGDIVLAMDFATLKALSDRNADGKPDEGVISAAITWASAKIDGKLANRYSVPLYASTVLATDATIRQMTIDMAKWRLLNGSPQPDRFADSVREAWKADYEDAGKMLDGWAEGTGKIPSITPTGVTAIMSVGMAGDTVEKAFTLSRTEIGGTEIDTDETGSLNVI